MPVEAAYRSDFCNPRPDRELSVLKYTLSSATEVQGDRRTSPLLAEVEAFTKANFETYTPSSTKLTIIYIHIQPPSETARDPDPDRSPPPHALTCRIERSPVRGRRRIKKNEAHGNARERGSRKVAERDRFGRRLRRVLLSRPPSSRYER